MTRLAKRPLGRLLRRIAASAGYEIVNAQAAPLGYDLMVDLRRLSGRLGSAMACMFDVA